MKTKKTNTFKKELAELIAYITKCAHLANPPGITNKRLYKKEDEKKLLRTAWSVAWGLRGIVYVKEQAGLSSRTAAKVLAKESNTWLYDLAASTKADLINILQKIKHRDVLVVGSYEKATLLMMELIVKINEEMEIGIILVSDRDPISDSKEYQRLTRRLAFGLSL